MDRSSVDVDAAVGNRRRVVQSAVALAATAALGNYQYSLAGRGWCRSDPLVQIGGILADIFCTAHLTTMLSVTGPTRIVVTTPPGVSAALILGGVGFGRGEQTSFETSDHLTVSASVTEIEVKVYVPAPEGLEIGVEFAPRVVGILDPVRADGFSNQWITLTTHLSLDKTLGLLPLDTAQPGQEKQRSRGKRKGKGKGKRKRH